MKNTDVDRLLAGLLTISFVNLKLIGIIDWSWWWVLSPLWITFTFVLGVFVLVAALTPSNKRGRHGQQEDSTIT